MSRRITVDPDSDLGRELREAIKQADASPYVVVPVSKHYRGKDVWYGPDGERFVIRPRKVRKQ
jgi:hypothetical protein